MGDAQFNHGDWPDDDNEDYYESDINSIEQKLLEDTAIRLREEIALLHERFPNSIEAYTKLIMSRVVTTEQRELEDEDRYLDAAELQSYANRLAKEYDSELASGMIHVYISCEHNDNLFIQVIYGEVMEIVKKYMPVDLKRTDLVIDLNNDTGLYEVHLDVILKTDSLNKYSKCKQKLLPKIQTKLNQKKNLQQIVFCLLLQKSLKAFLKL